jgi:hypothetical protein
MKKIFIYVFTLSVLNARAQFKLPKIDLASPATDCVLFLYSADSFALHKQYHTFDIIDYKLLYSGKYYYSHDTLFLATQDKVFTLKKETFEIYTPIYLDTLNSSQKFFAWTIRYPNGQTKQNGSWNQNSEKNGLWQYYDSSGAEIRKRVFKNGVLMDDNYKWPWEK